MKIAIASTGRFHVLDLARELHALGHEVKFYSYVPLERAERFGLPRACHVSLFRAALPFLAAHKLGARWAPAIDSLPFYKSLNRAVINKLEPCDVFICMSGVYLEAADYARERYGALIYLERGSMHVDRQVEILQALPSGARLPSPATIEREQKGYEIADRISVPSPHVAETFDRFATKTFVNAYGVDLEMFPRRQSDRTIGAPLEVLFVGNWSFQKGVDILANAVLGVFDAKLTHVGAVVDAPLPDHPDFQHIDSVDQTALLDFYQRSDLLVLPSRQDGFGMVLCQALAAGLPVVATDHTGGPYLKGLSQGFSARVEVVPSGNADALREAITVVGERIKRVEIGPISDADRQLLSWRAYGDRYAAELERAAGAKHLAVG
jgi:glycosyltransferase involved in cell wall biosynthesis